MTLPVLICDDSSFARKQMARALPDNWDVSLSFANNGVAAMDIIRQGQAEVLFLDLNMPEMDGYEVLECVRKEDLNTLVIVVSGDIQAEARQRVKDLGAMDFIKKPVNKDEIHTILSEFGILQLTDNANSNIIEDMQTDHFDFFKELANVSMGRGIDLLSRLLDVFIPMPIPEVKYITVNNLINTLKDIQHKDNITPICQGFIGDGIAGEVLLVFNKPELDDISRLMNIKGDITESIRMEFIMDISSVLSGACLNGLSEQLDIAFNLGHPRVLGQHICIQDLVDNKESGSWTKTLAIEMVFVVEEHNLHCSLLLLFTEDSLEKLNNLVSYIS